MPNLDDSMAIYYEKDYSELPDVATDEYMLTTVDNPFNPFTQSDEWEKFDKDHGYFTNSFLARKVVYSNQMSDNDKLLAIRDAVLEIVNDSFFSSRYKAVVQKL